MKKIAITQLLLAIGGAIILISLKYFRSNDQIVIAYPVDSDWPDGLGLGNQFMTFALAYQFAKKIGTDKIYIYHNKYCADDNDFKDPSKRCYGLHKFGLKYPLIKDIGSFIAKYDKNQIKDIDELKYFDSPKQDFSQFKVFAVKFLFTKQLFDCFAQDRDKLKNLFKYKGDLTSPAKQILSQIKNGESVAIHIRRGDYVSFGWNVPMSYQIRAAYFILEKVPSAKFFIFSDDSGSVRKYIANTKNIKEALSAIKIKSSPEQLQTFREKLKDATFVSEALNHSLEEFYLMSECKHNIAPRSTFSWWAAFLNKNPNKIVVAPSTPVHKKFDGNFPKIPANDGWVELF